MPTELLKEIVYPSSDGKPMADNTKQFRWIVTIEGGLEAVFQDDPEVFVAGDLLWYPVEGVPEICTAPDIFAVFGRPKGDRKSYKQWEEDNIAPQVTFEILSESNDFFEMRDKEDFYEEHGVEEYYVYDPYRNKLKGFIREGAIFRRIPQMNGWISPRLKVRFELTDTLSIYGPDGRQFLTYPQLVEERNRQQQRAEQEKQRAEQEKQRAEQEKQRAEQEKQRAELAERQHRELLEWLKAMGIVPESGN